MATIHIRGPSSCTEAAVTADTTHPFRCPILEEPMSRNPAASAILFLLAAARRASDATTAPLQPDSADRAVALAQPVRVPRPRLVLNSTTPFFGSNRDLTVTN